MKKLINKLFRKENEEATPPSRITTDTIEQHRERILAGGRRFKYPLQYSKHKLVISAIAISVATLIVLIVIGWWQLYPAQNTSEFIYRITKVIPVPVASIDGQSVLYSDYLMSYRSSIFFLESQKQLNAKTDDGKRQIEYFKQQSIQGVIADAYALKLANKLKISVSESELEGSLKEQRQSVDGEISQQTFDSSILDLLGLSPSEYRHMIKNGLLTHKVAYEMDKNALTVVDNATNTLKSAAATDLKSLAATLTSQTGTTVTYGLSGWVPKINLDGGLSSAAAKLAKSQLSSTIKSTKGEGYFIIRLLDINDTKVSYEYIKIPLTTFDKELKAAIDSGKLSKFISI